MADETVKNGVAEGGEESPSDAIDGNTKAGTSASAGGKKGKKGKNKTKSAGGEAGPVSGANLSADQQEKLKKAMEILNLQSQGGAVGPWGWALALVFTNLLMLCSSGQERGGGGLQVLPVLVDTAGPVH